MDKIKLVNPDAESWYEKLGITNERAVELADATYRDFANMIDSVFGPNRKGGDVEQLALFASHYAQTPTELAFLIINGYDILQELSAMTAAGTILAKCNCQDPLDAAIEDLRKRLKPGVFEAVLEMDKHGRTSEEIDDQLDWLYPTGIYLDDEANRVRNILREVRRGNK